MVDFILFYNKLIFFENFFSNVFPIPVKRFIGVFAYFFNYLFIVAEFDYFFSETLGVIIA